MLSIVACLLAFIAGFIGGRRSLITGLATTLAVGYAYGILRANIPQSFSHFIFDAAVVGLYAAQLRRPADAVERERGRSLRPWLLLLVGWPILLSLVPVQDPLIQIVGLRGHIFFVPFMILGTRLDDRNAFGQLAVWLSVLNVIVFGFAVAEFFIGIEPFFPRNAVTELIYRSRDLAGNTAFRIPATFSSAHAYASAMAGTIPIVAGAFIGGATRGGKRTLLLLGLLTALIGIFMAAARVHMVILALLVITATLSTRVRAGARVAWLVTIAIVMVVVAQDERLQRFSTLQDRDYVEERVQGSVNRNFLELVRDYPMGNGIGGGGTSIPYFLADRLRDPIGLENEYARILLEQGLPGLIAWLCFLVWALVLRRRRFPPEAQMSARLARVVCLSYLAAGMIGTGLFTSIPLTPLLFLFMGWLIARPVGQPHAVTVTSGGGGMPTAALAGG